MTTSNSQTSLLCFDGVDDCVEILHQNKLNPPNFTVEAWVLNLNTAQTDFCILSSNVSRWPYIYEFVQYTKRLMFGLFNGAGFAEGRSMLNNVWTHLAGTYDQASQICVYYINGKQVCNKSITNRTRPSSTTDEILYIGTHLVNSSSQPRGRFFKGYIDEVRIWNIVRTEQQIQETFNKPLTGKEPNLVGYWRLSNLSGNKVPDLTGNGLDGIIYGNATSQLINNPPFITPQPEKTKTINVDINSASGTPFKNDFQQEVSFKISATGTWKPSTWADCTPAGWPGFEYQNQMKYPSNTSFALLVVDAETNTVLAELGNEITLVLKPSQTITFVVNDVPVNDGYQDNTGHLSITSVAQIP
ncbi:LamG domain-containing protein [Planktothrix mougeotii]|uniref:LamG domain-containing protein n=1 Tax=Planktothrix mougeotii LEGE 06226 TaxID=1828728 RepID=A0ABR9UDJ2_9CYAN|nr:LamG domain-containing protein [Planktothrix mougeotii]MBE9143639.1 LamG domain-containing protein [Planktothrix mougeotii LEGE 06226]